MLPIRLSELLVYVHVCMYYHPNNSLDFARKHVWIFVLRYYLFLEANSFPRAMLLRTYSAVFEEDLD